MVDGGAALAAVIILSFVGFTFWGRSASGRDRLRATLGEPSVPTKRKPSRSPAKRRAKKGGKPATTRRSSR